jgi:hypothetical protein
VAGTTAGNTYTLTINGVKDLAGNAIAANTKATFTPSTAKAFYSFEGGQLPLNTEILGNATLEPTVVIRPLGKLSLSAAAAATQTSIVQTRRFAPDFARVVTRDEALRLALKPAQRTNRARRNGRRLAASAHAETTWIRFRNVRLWTWHSGLLSGWGVHRASGDLSSRRGFAVPISIAH